MSLILTIATILGGIAALWYFWDKITALVAQRQIRATLRAVVQRCCARHEGGRYSGHFVGIYNPNGPTFPRALPYGSIHGDMLEAPVMGRVMRWVHPFATREYTIDLERCDARDHKHVDLLERSEDGRLCFKFEYEPYLPLVPGRYVVDLTIHDGDLAPQTMRIEVISTDTDTVHVAAV